MQRRRYVSRFAVSVSFATVSHVEPRLLNLGYDLLPISHFCLPGFEDMNVQNVVPGQVNIFQTLYIKGVTMLLPGPVLSINIDDKAML